MQTLTFLRRPLSSVTETYFCTLDPDESLYLYTITIIIALGAVYLFTCLFMQTLTQKKNHIHG